MSIEYLLVVYNGDRDVLADGDRVGVTNHTILLAPDEYTITLSGDGYAPPSEDVILEAINSGCARRIVVIAVNARADMDNGVGKNPAVPELLKVVNTVIGTPIDSTTARSNASLQDLVDMLKEAGVSSARAPGQPLFAGLRVYNIPVDFDQVLPEQRQLQTAVKNIGTSWNLSPIQLQASIDAGRILLLQHPCFQRLLLDLKALPAPAEPAIVRKSCPFEDDKTLQRLAPLADNR
jgi:hypothetical protein